MPTIEFEASEWGPSATIERPDGGRLVDICDDARAPVSFSCRSASCGTCRVEVLNGLDLLASAGGEEREVLAIFAAPPTHRLACQALVVPGAGRVTLRWVRED